MAILGKLLAGGQTWVHRVRMLRYVVKIATITSLVYSLIILSILLITQPFVTYQSLWYYVKANTLGVVFSHVDVDSKYWEYISNESYGSKTLQIPSRRLTAYSEPHVDIFIEQLKDFLLIGFISFIIIFACLQLFFIVRGYLTQRKKHISGRRFAPSWMVSLKLKAFNKNSNIQLGKLPLVRGTETQHIMVTGGTGSGKTNCFHHILPQIRQNNHKALVVDTTGSLVNRYYIPGRDIILNPFDALSEPWHPWAECTSKFDYEDIAECFIPHSHSDHEDYWRNASRALFVSLLSKAELSKKTSNLTRWIQFESLSSLCAYVKGTKGAAHIDPSSEKTAASIRSVTSSFLSCLEFIDDTSASFSIRDWVQDDNQRSWLFLTCTPAQRASMRPLISSWFSIATKSLIQHTPDLDRRVWFIVDELQSLNKLKDLEVFLTESRKYGGCALLALQSISQLDAIYGREITKTIIGNCATKVAFSEQDPEIASRISKAFGEREIKEFQEGISYGAHETRDGVNLSLQTKNQPVVSVTAIQSLKRNQAYVKLPENYPITKIKLPIVPKK